VTQLYVFTANGALTAEDVVALVKEDRISGESVAEIVDALLSEAGVTVTPTERDMFVNDYPRIRANVARLAEFGEDTEAAATFDPASFYREASQ
jgi:hypothetical protein